MFLPFKGLNVKTGKTSSTLFCYIMELTFILG